MSTLSHALTSRSPLNLEGVMDNALSQMAVAITAQIKIDLRERVMEILGQDVTAKLRNHASRP